MFSEGNFINQLNIFLFIAISILWAVTIHEYFHGLVAFLCGDTTARDNDRLNLNPFKHLDLIGTLMLVIFKFGWAKPIPINYNNFPVKRKKFYCFLVSLAGSFGNIFTALITSIILWIFSLYNFPGFIKFMIFNLGHWLILYNIWFAIFNLLPFPPLDGFKIILAILPDKVIYKNLNVINFLDNYSFWIVLILAYLGIINFFIEPLVNPLLKFLLAI